MTKSDAIARIEEIGNQIVLKNHLAEASPSHAKRQLAVIESLRTERDRLYNFVAYH